MTRNIQCREMIEDVQRQVAGLSFQDNKNTGAFNSNYPSVGHQNQRSNPQQTDTRRQAPYYQPSEQPPVSGYVHPPTTYGPGPAHQPPPPYHIPQTSGSPYPPPPQVHHQPPANHDYGQPAYPGWRGPYYNAQAQQQPASVPRPPYTVPSPYPPHQSGYYKQQ